MAEQLSLLLRLPPPGLVQLWTSAQIFEQIDSDNIHHFIEDRRVERKSTNVQAKSLAEYLSMWSNTQPHGGLIIVGIDDQGRIVGCKGQESHLNDLESCGIMCPDAKFETKKISVKNFRDENDYLLIFYVKYHADKLVETTAGKAFIREGDKRSELNEVVKREIRIAKREIHHELEGVGLRFPADFDMPEVQKFCKIFSTTRKFQQQKSIAEILELAKLGKRVDNIFQPNLACALLFGNDPREIIPGARIRVIKYDGTEEKFGTELNRVFSEYVDGNIAKILFHAKSVIASQMRSFQRYDATGRLIIQQEYPEEVWFEAIVNAVAHRSYNLRTQNIFVKIFDDHFVVESPGGFVPPTTAQTVYDAHNPRNPYLMEAMMHLELTFNGFEGTRRMRNAMRAAGLPEPRFRQIEAQIHQVHVVLENNVAFRRYDNTSENMFGISATEYHAMSDEEKQILDFLVVAPNINITTASLITGRSWPTAQKFVLGLVHRGILVISTAGRKKHDSKKGYTLAKRQGASSS
ncbi:hypothetical protein EJV46_10205 [Roseococcus sp. SYP-B2431]|uniref:ATP-binding protein n=1 Tax=Roseococcus sp. SYP-B2431 TaxID=2496640 RepID=UPI00103A9B51|nr:ATP-binding protein [Roseococcus sp. SYP-B2431]TCH98917.1 hypothetical protein EJV46_10205 [Roseococcus sp. SYP-B2431]